MCPSGRIAIPITTTTTAAKNSDFRPAFEIIDADRDGKISSEDLRAFYAGISRSSSGENNHHDETMIGTMISVADANKDGFVEFDEFERVLEEATAPLYRSDDGLMKDMFTAMDKDGDGRLSYGDLKSYMDSAGLAVTDDDIKAMIRLAGGNLNGGVSFDGLLKIFGC
ncbi:PREDICTED: calmodulin-like [Camelina sativa]|uniref:Calmodulin-like n=1 Tax=Camelina sativa TaxID=90675 RepID=A0ABM0UKC9_CAMSA|nr:PREDICTED: calmodulin-like [Camelina sativa]